MSLPARIVAALICAVLLIGVGFRFGVRFKQAEWDAATVAAQTERGEALKAAAQAIAEIDHRGESLAQAVRVEVRTRTVYKECNHSDTALKDLNSLIVGDQADKSHGGGDEID